MHVRSKMAIHSPLNNKYPKSVKLWVVLKDLLCLILLHELPPPPGSDDIAPCNMFCYVFA